MKRLNQWMLGAATLALVAGVMSGCGGSTGVSGAKASSVEEEQLGLRKTTIYSEKQEMTQGVHYQGSDPGTNKVYDRAFENAPPMIPHSVEGLLPITAASNACTGCHMPEVAPMMNATAIPKSHLTNLRTGEDLQGQLYQGRYNCSQCHAPQDQRDPAVVNNFQAEFRTQSGEKQSNLLDVLNEGVR